GRAAGPWLFNTVAFTAAALNLTWDANNAAITYGGPGGAGDWSADSSSASLPRRGAVLMVTNVLGATATFTVPAGATTLTMGGHKDGAGSFFTLQRNGTRVVQTDQYAASASDGEYLPAAVAVTPGDTIIFTRTDPNFNTAPGGPNPNVRNYLDQIHFSS
ncbi:hypothetical protein, partial [Hymenobacter agri]